MTKKKPTKKKAAKKKVTKKTPAKKKVTKKTTAPEQLALIPEVPAGPPPASISVGDMVPAFSLPADDGSTYNNDDLLGRRYVIYFYPRDNTPGCTKEACQFSELDGFRALDISVLGVSPDSLQSHAKFRDEHKLSIVLLTDPEKTVSAAFGAWGEKSNYGRTYMGIIRSTFIIGPDGRVERVFQPVRKADGHAAQVLEELR